MHHSKILLLLFMALLLSSCTGIRIVDRPITFDQTRKDLSLAYIKEHHSLTQAEPTIDPKIILIHHTVIPTLEGTFRAFDPSLLPSHREVIKGASSLNVSSQFVIDRDGTIYRLLPETTFARHVIGLNYCSIGVENVGGTRETPLTDAQLKANVKLVKYLSKKYPGIEYVIGHHEYQAFRDHPLWKEADPNYLTSKSDPGDAFMNRIRQKIKNLGLKGTP